MSEIEKPPKKGPPKPEAAKDLEIYKIRLFCKDLEDYLESGWGLSREKKEVYILVDIGAGKDDAKIYNRLRIAIRDEYGAAVRFFRPKVVVEITLMSFKKGIRKRRHNTNRRPRREIIISNIGTDADYARLNACIKKAGIILDNIRPI